MTVFNIRTWADVRALIHLIAPAAAAILVASGVATETLVAQILTLVLAVLSPALATVNTVNGFRVWFYPVLAALSAVLVYLNVFTDSTWSLWLPVIVLLIGPAVAVANTPTTIDGEVESVVDTEHDFTHYNEFGDPV